MLSFHVAWMNIYYNWLLIKLIHKKDYCLSPAQTRSKSLSLTDLCTLHIPCKYFIKLNIGYKVHILQNEPPRGQAWQDSPLGCWNDLLLGLPAWFCFNWCCFQRLVSRTAWGKAANPRWSQFIQPFRLFQSGLQLNPELTQRKETGQQTVPTSFLLT